MTKSVTITIKREPVFADGTEWFVIPFKRSKHTFRNFDDAIEWAHQQFKAGLIPDEQATLDLGEEVAE